MLTPYPADRLRYKHPPPARFETHLKQPIRPGLRASLFEADFLPYGAKIGL